MNDRPGFDRIAVGDGLTLAAIDRNIYKAKYLCLDCNQLRLPSPFEMPTFCAGCGSANIDIETNLESQRLEAVRFGDSDSPHVRQSKEAIRTLTFSRDTKSSFWSKETITKSSLAEMGEYLNPITYKHADTEDDVEANIDSYIAGHTALDPTGSSFFGEAMKIPDQVILMLGSACWFNSGLPVIRLGHKRAAALMATEITDHTIEYVKAPFPAFFIELPGDLLHVQDSTEEMRPATGVLVHSRSFVRDHEYQGRLKTAGTYWNYVILTDSSLIQWKLSRLIEEIAGLKDRGNDWVGIGLPLSDYDTRLDLLIGRLICSTCIMMSNPDNLKAKVEPTRRNKTGKKAAKDCPNYKVFLEKQPINVDARRYVSAYLKGERDSLHVRLMVRGHHKMQHYGPQRALRKLIWIEPYMRGGAEGDPIMKSIYVAKDKNGKIPEADRV